MRKLLSSHSPDSSGTALCSGPSWGFGLPLASTQLRYKLPATCSSTFFLNLSPLSRTPPSLLSSVTTHHIKFCSTQRTAQESSVSPSYRFPHHCPSALLPCLAHPIAISLAQSLCLVRSASVELFVEIAAKC